ncbi:MAG TPA: sigma-E factor negative regulatory protein [Rhodanobacteraceae bacterium]|nr:sigma-E factor negative regulatory protein [Rhodanobacteraceae bacterium]
MEERDSRENLSALMDGELGAEPARFLLRRMESDPGLADSWSRWHLIRACLAQRAPASPHSDPLRIGAASDDDAFATRVTRAIRAQPRRHWARYIGGGAIAASVAAAALILAVPQSTSTDAVVAGAERAATAAASPIPSGAPQVARIAAAPVSGTPRAPWLDRQSTFLAAQPAAPGSAALSGSYLQQAAYAPDSLARPAPMLMGGTRQHDGDAPYLILLVPDRNAEVRSQQH